VYFHLALQFQQTVKPLGCNPKDGGNKWEKFDEVFVIQEFVHFVGVCISR